MLALANEMRARGETGAIVSLLCDSGERYLRTYFDADWSLARFGDTGAASEQVQTQLHGA
jgi:cysteine synthase A